MALFFIPQKGKQCSVKAYWSAAVNRAFLAVIPTTGEEWHRPQMMQKPQVFYKSYQNIASGKWIEGASHTSVSWGTLNKKKDAGPLDFTPPSFYSIQGFLNYILVLLGPTACCHTLRLWESAFNPCPYQVRPTYRRNNLNLHIAQL